MTGWRYEWETLSSVFPNQSIHETYPPDGATYFGNHANIVNENIFNNPGREQNRVTGLSRVLNAIKQKSKIKHSFTIQKNNSLAHHLSLNTAR